MPRSNLHFVPAYQNKKKFRAGIKPLCWFFKICYKDITPFFHQIMKPIVMKFFCCFFFDMMNILRFHGCRKAGYSRLNLSFKWTGKQINIKKWAFVQVNRCLKKWKMCLIRGINSNSSDKLSDFIHIQTWKFVRFTYTNVLAHPINVHLPFWNFAHLF